ncbi:MAG: integrase, partial [Curvibacter sp.]
MGTKLGTTGTEATREDMANPPGMELHGSSWRVKKRVPLDLLRDHPQYYPKPFLRLNTEESDKKRAAAKAWAWLGTIEETFQRVRDTGSPYKRQVPDDVAEEIIQKAIHSVLSADEETRSQGHEPEILDAFRSDNEVYLQREREAIANGRLTEGQLQTANEWLFAHGYELAADAPELRQFALKLFRALSRPRQIQRQRDAGDWVDTPPMPVRKPAPNVPKLSKVIEYFIGKQKTDVPMFKKYRPALGLFLEYVGDKTVDQLKQKEIDDFFAFLCKLPPRWDDEKRKRKVSAVFLAQMEWPKCISRKTFEDGYMAAFRPFLTASVRVFQGQGFPGTLTTNGIKYS